MNSSGEARLTNLLGAMATGLTDRTQNAAYDTAQLHGCDPAALIALIDFAPDGTVQALSEICGLSHSGGVRLVNRLVEAGYVQRDPGRDARSVTVTLTPAGRVVAFELRAARKAAINATMNGLTKRQREELAKACSTIISALTEQRLTRRANGQLPTGGALCRLCDFDACQRAQGHCPAARTARDWSGPQVDGATPQTAKRMP